MHLTLTDWERPDNTSRNSEDYSFKCGKINIRLKCADHVLLKMFIRGFIWVPVASLGVVTPKWTLCFCIRLSTAPLSRSVIRLLTMPPQKRALSPLCSAALSQRVASGRASDECIVSRGLSELRCCCLIGIPPGPRVYSLKSITRPAHGMPIQ